MLELTIPAKDFFDEKKEEFIKVNEVVLKLEHSLVSISKWESKWCKPFLDKSCKKTREQTIDYVRFMTMTQNVDPLVYEYLDNETIEKVNKYIEAPMTATWFSDRDNKNSTSSEVVTSELIYYWMIALNIPVEFQKWHLNRLLTLIKVCNLKNAPSKKMSRSEILKRNRELNNKRKQMLGTNG